MFYLSFFLISFNNNKVWNVNKFSSPREEFNFSDISFTQVLATPKPFRHINKVQANADEATSWLLFVIACFNNLSTTFTLEASVICPNNLKQFGFIKSSSLFNSVINDPVKIKLLCHQFKCFKKNKFY